MIPKSEWVRRCAKRIMALTGCGWNSAQNIASSCARDQADENGESGLAWQSPEDAADEFCADDN